MDLNLLDFLIDEALILIPALMILGKILKETPYVRDWMIPHMLLIIGIIMSIAMLGINVSSIIQGILVTGSAVLGHELIKQSLEREG